MKRLFYTEKTARMFPTRFYVRANVTYRRGDEIVLEEVHRTFFYSMVTLDDAIRAVRREFRFALNVEILESGRI